MFDKVIGCQSNKLGETNLQIDGMAKIDTRSERETSLLSINGRVNKNNGQFGRNDSPNKL